MKKGSLPIMVIFALLISIVGIMLVFALWGGNISVTKKLYCRTIYPLKSSMGFERNSYCDDFLSMEVIGLNKKEKMLKLFNGGKYNEAVKFEPGTTISHTITMTFPRYAVINSAEVKIALEEERVYLLENLNTNEVKIAHYMILPNSAFYYDYLVDVPDTRYKLLNNKLELSGVQKPDKATLIFIIDVSPSLSNEWTSVCSLIDEIANEVNKEQVDNEIYVYALGDGSPAYVTCEDYVIDSADIEASPYHTDYNKNRHGCQNDVAGGDYCPLWGGCDPYDCQCDDPADDATEAWGTGIMMVADTFDFNFIAIE